MNKRLLSLIVIIASCLPLAANGDNDLKTRFGDELLLLKHLQKYNAIKRASVVHKEVRYHIYVGGRGSGIRRFNGFVFRETDKVFTLIAHNFYKPYGDKDLPRIVLMAPEIDTTGIRFLGRRGDHVKNRELEIARYSFSDLTRIDKEGIQYLSSSNQHKE